MSTEEKYHRERQMARYDKHMNQYGHFSFRKCNKKKMVEQTEKALHPPEQEQTEQQEEQK